MGFLKPKIPKPDPAPNPAMEAIDPSLAQEDSGLANSAASLVSTASRGLTRKANTQRKSLIGGSR